MEESALGSQREPWIISSLIKSYCTEWACSLRWSRLLVSQQASSVSLYHSNTCEALCQPPSATNQPPHYYKRPHSGAPLLHWMDSRLKEGIGMFMYVIRVTARRFCEIILRLNFSFTDPRTPTPAACELAASPFTLPPLCKTGFQ